MPRNMSFALTTEQFKNKTKTVTRRFGWDFLQPGDIVCGVEKAMGLKKGEKINKLGLIKIKSIRMEALLDITQTDCAREGFPQMTPDEFVGMLISHDKTGNTNPMSVVNRIEYEYL